MASPNPSVPDSVHVQPLPRPRMHQRDVSALTDIILEDDAEDVTTRAGNQNVGEDAILDQPIPKPDHRRGVSIDLTRRHFTPKLNEGTPPRARGAEGKASATVKKSTWGAATKYDQKVVGLGTAARYSVDRHEEHKGLSASNASRYKRESIRAIKDNLDLAESDAREKAESSPFRILIIGGVAAVKVFFVYLITLDTIFSIALSVGLTCYWYFTYSGTGSSVSWAGGGMDWVLLGFAVVTPLSMAIGIAFRRRERALIDITRFKSFSYQIYLAHCVWDWGKPPAGRAATNCDWLRHTDQVLEQLIGISDELTRFLTLPTYSRTRHRMMKSGRREAARTVKVAYRLFDSLYTQRVLKLTLLTEALKYEGINHSEASRIRQYERFLGECIEDLRVIKSYRTPQALRAFGRLFTVLLPPFYAPSFAQLAMDLNSLGMGICMGIITPLCLTALFESIQVLEDPFTGYITLDGIDCTEELRVLQWMQLCNVRKIMFPNAPNFSSGPSPPVMWEVVQELSPSSDLIEDSAHPSEDTPTIDNTEVGEDEMNRISLHDLEAGYASDDSTIDMRTSNFRDALREQANNNNIGASFRAVRRRLPSVESLRNIGASRTNRRLPGSRSSRQSSLSPK